jgi:hypothetical protein
VYGPDGTAVVEDQLMEVSECGTGFMMIKKGVLDHMFAAYPGLKHR